MTPHNKRLSPSSALTPFSQRTGQSLTTSALLPFSPKKGQTAIEYLTITTIALAVLVPLIFFGFNTLQSNTEDSALSRSQNSLQNLAQVADSVCISPTGTKKRASLSVPPQANLQTSGFGLQNRTLNIHVLTADRNLNLTATTTCQLTQHRLSDHVSNSGSFFFTVKKEKESLVNITRAR